ncbi:MAG: transcriptional repressor [Bacteroidia bacterium]
MSLSTQRHLRSHGLRCTEPRRCIVEALRSGPKTHAELLCLTRLDRVTVYRNLVTLQRVGLVYRVYFPGKPSLYVLCQQGQGTHAHFFCQKCHKAFCLPSEAVQLTGVWAGRTERIILFGQCPECG